MLRFNVLGPIEVLDDGIPLAIGGPRQRRLICALLVAEGGVVSTDLLVERLWDDHDRPEGAQQGIRSYVARLRRALEDHGGAVVTTPTGYCLDLTDHAVDALELARLSEEAQRAVQVDPTGAEQLLAEAANLWAGEPFAEFSDVGWLTVEVHRFVELRRSVVEDLLATRVRSNPGPELLGQIERAIADYPFSESLRGTLMLALAQAGRSADALREYESYRQLLAEETGLEPGDTLREIDRRVVSGEVMPAGASTYPRRASLPVSSSPLIGREKELSEVENMLSDCRVVTIAGPAGFGKTRLVTEVGHQLRSTFEHGVHFVDLRAVRNNDGFTGAVVETLELRVNPAESRTKLLDYLDDKDALIILDNCEHLIEPCSEFAERLLNRGGDSRLLTTSREPLGVPGEQVARLSSLDCSADGPAVELFNARAAVANAASTPGSGETIVVSELCERLDGMPLAIELAAARARVMSPREILDRLDNRFRVLSGSSRRGSIGGRTLKATLDWSYDLLEHDERRVLDSIGVFAGAFDSAAVAAVAELSTEDTLETLDSLVSKSLVVTERAGNMTIFRLLETVRDYAAEHLAQAGTLASTRDQHLAHYLKSAIMEEDAAIAATGISYGWSWDALQRWNHMKSNLYEAIDWAIASNRLADAVDVLTKCARIWCIVHDAEPMIQRLDILNSRLDPQSDLHDRLLYLQMDRAFLTEDRQRWIEVSEQMAQSPNSHTRRCALANIGLLVERDRALEIAAEIEAMGPDPGGEAARIRVYVYMAEGELEQARDYLRPYVGRNLDLLNEGTFAGLLLLTGKPEEALEFAVAHPMTDSSWRPFDLTVALSLLALGHLDQAERLILDQARPAILGRAFGLSNSSLISMAALVNHHGDADWARAILLSAPTPRTSINSYHARALGESLGIFDAIAARHEHEFRTGLTDGTPQLREVLYRWDRDLASSTT